MPAISRILQEVHAQFQSCAEGRLASYIPELAKANPEWYGISLVTTDGHRYSVGDSSQEFTIQSVSKPFGYGMALDEHGLPAVLSRIGVEPSGEASNEISLEDGSGRPFNPMVNAGAIAATGMIRGITFAARLERLRQGLSAYAGRELRLDANVYHSESAAGFRNRAIAYLLRNSNMLDGSIEDTLELYFGQCSFLVTCEDLAVMGASLANGGVNPITGKPVLKPEHVNKVLSVMSTCGMYDATGEWIFKVGLPAKSGAGGGILGVLPGQMGLAVFSPLLDPRGNSVRGVKTFTELSQRFNLHQFNVPGVAQHSVRNVYLLSQIDSRRQRPRREREIIQRHGDRVTAIEMQGNLFFSSMERTMRLAQGRHARTLIIILDVTRVNLANRTSENLLHELARDLRAEQKQLFVVDPKKLFAREGLPERILFFDEVETALEKAERFLILEQTRERPWVDSLVPFHDFEIFSGLSPAELTSVERLLQMQRYRPGDTIVRQGSQPDYLYLLAKGAVAIVIRTDTHQRRVGAFSPGVSFGDMAIVSNNATSADVVAESEAICYQIAAADFLALEASNPALYAKIIKNLLRINVEILRRNHRELASLKEEPARVKW